MGTAVSLPRASREQVLAAVAYLEKDGPATVGLIGVFLAPSLGVDTRHMINAYQLRSSMSWTGLLTELRGLVRDGELVRRTEADWHRLTGGRLFPSRPSDSTWAYATAATAATVACRERDECARAWALERLAEEFPDRYAALVEQWQRDHPPAWEAR